SHWTQTQYYVGANKEHVALYRGISQDLGWVSLSKIEKETDIELKYLPDYQRKQVEATIAESSLTGGRDKIDELAVQASACKKDEQRRLATKTTDTKPKATTPSPGPSLSEEEQKVASNCGKQ
ncbi:protein phosphatase, partial [Streptomyces sp. NPDC056730]